MIKLIPWLTNEEYTELFEGVVKDLTAERDSRFEKSCLPEKYQRGFKYPFSGGLLRAIIRYQSAISWTFALLIVFTLSRLF